jgi:hypothetical protein
MAGRIAVEHFTDIRHILDMQLDYFRCCIALLPLVATSYINRRQLFRTDSSRINSLLTIHNKL